MNFSRTYMPGDAVFYIGDRLKAELTAKDGKPYKGWIHAPVQNESDRYVVWFPDTKDDASYILSDGVLTKARPPRIDKIQSGPIVEHMPTRRRKGDDE